MHGDLDDGSARSRSASRPTTTPPRSAPARPATRSRQTYLLTDNRASDAGWRLVGYEARGPRGGPIVVATVRAKDRNRDGVFDDAKDLVTLNVGRITRLGPAGLDPAPGWVT